MALKLTKPLIIGGVAVIAVVVIAAVVLGGGFGGDDSDKGKGPVTFNSLFSEKEYYSPAEIQDILDLNGMGSIDIEEVLAGDGISPASADGYSSEMIAAALEDEGYTMDELNDMVDEANKALEAAGFGGMSIEDIMSGGGIPGLTGGTMDPDALQALLEANDVDISEVNKELADSGYNGNLEQLLNDYESGNLEDILADMDYSQEEIDQIMADIEAQGLNPEDLMSGNYNPEDLTAGGYDPDAEYDISMGPWENYPEYTAGLTKPSFLMANAIETNGYLSITQYDISKDDVEEYIRSLDSGFNVDSEDLTWGISESGKLRMTIAFYGSTAVIYVYPPA